MVKIEKEEKKVIAYIGSYKVKGTIFMPTGARLSDFLGGVGAKQFIPMGEVVVSDISGNEICRSDFMELNKDKIIFLMPQEVK